MIEQMPNKETFPRHSCRLNAYGPLSINFCL